MVAIIGKYMRMSAAELTKKHSVQIVFDPMLEVPALSESSLKSKDYILNKQLRKGHKRNK